MFTAIINERTYEIGQDKGNYTLNGQAVQLDLKDLGDGHYHLIHNDRSYTIELLDTADSGRNCSLKVNGKKVNVQLRSPLDQLLTRLGFDVSGGSKVNEIKAPMPGLVLNVFVSEGQAIKKGDGILVLEAMKMENVLKAPADGIVSKVHVKAKDKVEKNQVLLNLD